MTTPKTDRASALLKAAPVIDGHNDLPWALRGRLGPDARAVVAGIDLTEPQPDLHTDLGRLRRGGVGGQFWSVYVPCELSGHAAVTAVLEQIEIVHALVERYPEHLRLARSAGEVEAAVAAGRVASLLGAEGGHCIAGSLGVLRALHRLGVRYLTLTHNKNVPHERACERIIEHCPAAERARRQGCRHRACEVTEWLTPPPTSRWPAG